MGVKFDPLLGRLRTSDDVIGTSPSDSFTREDREITALEDANQALTLVATPLDPTKVSLDIPNGPVQINGFDFEVIGNVLSWGGLALELTLEEGDKIVVEYFTA